MDTATADCVKNFYHVIVTEIPGGGGSFRVTIAARQLMASRAGGALSRVPTPAEVTVTTRPQLSVSAFQPPEQSSGISEQDYREAALDSVRAKLQKN